jgi:hypothetical protein
MDKFLFFAVDLMLVMVVDDDSFAVDKDPTLGVSTQLTFRQRSWTPLPYAS